MRTAVLLATALTMVATSVSAIDLCSGGHRAERSVTCLIDGDTGWENGVKWRYEGIDTPEIGHANCAREERAGHAATRSLQQLLAGGYWYPRGGISIDVFWQTGEPLPGVWLPDQGIPPYRGRG